MSVSEFANISIDQAISFGLPVYDVLLFNWGTSDRDCYPIRGGAPAAPPMSFPITPYMVSIGPRSTVDRTWFSWNIGPTGKVASVGFVAELLRDLSLQSPVLFPVQAGKGAADAVDSVFGAFGPPGAMYERKLYVFPEVDNVSFQVNGYAPRSTRPPTAYTKADGSAGVFAGAHAIIVPPALHLQFWLKPNFGPPPTKRLEWSTAGLTGGGGLGGIETTGLICPSFGRSKIVIAAAPDAVGAQIRIGAIRNTNSGGGIVQETTEGLKTSTVANATLRFEVCGPGIDWTIVYFTPPDDVLLNVPLTITMTD